MSVLSRFLPEVGHSALLALCLGVSLGCSSSSNPASTDPPSAEGPNEPSPLLPGGSEVSGALSTQQAEELSRLSGELDILESLDTDGLLARHPAELSGGVSYDPAAAVNFAQLQASSLALDGDEQAVLDARGFVISERQIFPSFVRGYETIYMNDLPVYISADSVLHAVHRSYDDILEAIERTALVSALGTMLGGMRAELASASLDSQVRQDLDLYLAVAKSLLDSQWELEVAAPVAGASASDIEDLTQQAWNANGMQTVELFGVPRDIDFSQMTPRGHYDDQYTLAAYFRAMMWLGRVDFRIIETQPDGSQRFHRRQLEGALAMRDLMNTEARAAWQAIDDTVAAFVGESDNMTLPELDSLLTDLGATDLAGIAELEDEAISQAIIAGEYGTQQICSHLMIDAMPQGGTLPLNRSFLLLGQRYVVDSHVFSSVVWDRVEEMRMMPDPLDVAFAALGNDQALPLLEGGLRQYGYAPQLGQARLLVDEHGEAYWQSNLYNLWLGALRELSPSTEAAGLPEVATTEPWGRRLLNTQLASWAELRHDTILYAKQSYTTGATCEFPDAYVDPYPEAFARLAQFAELGQGLVSRLPIDSASYLGGRITSYFSSLRTVATTLAEMAEYQRTGTEHTAEHLAFINQAVSVVQLPDCVPRYGAEGWYAHLFFDTEGAVEFDPTIADVHTQPTDEAGNQVGRILHVGTGAPRLLVVAVDTCTGPRAYAGLASAYFERVTENFERLTDDTWATELTGSTPADVEWMSDLVVR